MPIDEITSPELSPHCMRCMLDKYLDASPEGTPWQTKARYMREALFAVAEDSKNKTAPEISHRLSALLETTYGIKRDYEKDKRHFNQLVLGMERQLSQRIDASADPLDLAIRCALAGNFIDFGPTGHVDEQTLIKLVDDAAAMALDTDALADLKERIARAKTIAYLTDNCGEIVLDKLLIARIAEVNPLAKVTAIVRGAPTLNDATIEDAQQVGLDQVTTVMGNGSDLAGTCLDSVNAETIHALNCSDLVISKGLANYETLCGRGTNTYFLFLCKCQLYVEVFGVPLYTGMVVRGV